jgi:hypothetical protein
MTGLTDSDYPTPRADVELIREKTDFHIEGSVGPVKGKLHLITEGLGRSPVSVVGTMFLLVFTACFPPALIWLFGWLSHAPALPLIAIAAAVFIVLFITATIVVFKPGQRPATPAEAPRHVIVQRAAVQEDNGTTARGHQALHPGNRAEHPEAATRARRTRPSRH